MMKKIKKNMEYLINNYRKKEQEKILDNFYTKKIKNGRGNRAIFLDKLFLIMFVEATVILLLDKLIDNFIISLLIGLLILWVFIKYIKRINEKQRALKVEEIKKEYKIRLIEEKLISEDDDMEDYIIARYYEKKGEIKSNMSFIGKNKIFKLYFLSIIFFISSYFVTYMIYYKLVSVFVFLVATIIGSYNLTEYIKKRDNRDLLNKNIDI